ncbi:armadillo-type protein, partial [Halteromyces radiatus]|uniref:armadillo-type protein n=1 Tax=Halteromyces radiatus TaxID=101107 RepID=UPI002221299C
MSVLDEQLVHTRSELYMEIKIICEPLIKHTGSMTRDFGRIATSCLTELLHKLESVSDPEAVIDPVLIDAILYPLFRLFKEVVQDSLYFDTVFEGLLHCLRFLLNNTLWSCTFSNSMSKQSIVLYTNCLKRFNNNNNNNNKSDRSLTSGATDSIKLLAIQCISASLPIPPSRISTAAIDQPQHHNIHLLPVLYSEPFKYILSETVLELLAIIQRDHDLTLRLAALDTLHQLLFDNLQEPDYLSLFLPGVTSTLCKVIWQKQEKEHHQVIIYALDIISNMVQCVMEISRNKDFLDSVHSLEDLKHIWQTMSIGNEDDENDNKKKDDISTGVNKIDSGTDEQQSTKSTIWTQERYKQTKEALYNLLKGVLKICNHPHWEVRLAFVDLCYKLLKKCWATLDNCIPLFINTVVQLVDDEYPQVASTCKQHISDLNCMYDFETSLMPDLKEGLYTAMMTLPQHLISGDEQSKLYAMRRITGYTYFLQHHAGTVFDAALNRISDGWMAALEIDKHSLNVLEEKQSTRYIELGDDEISTQKQQQQQLQQGQQRSLRTVAFPALRFKHLVTTATAEQATHMLNIIAQFVPLQRWLTHFMAYIHVDDEEISLDQVQPEAAFIIHSLLAGAVTSTMTLPGSQTTVGEFILYDNKENNTGDTQETTKTTTLELQKQAHRILTDMTETLTAMTTTVNKSKEAKKSTKLTTSGNPSTTIELEGNKVVTICLGLQIISLAAYIIGRDRTEEHLIKLLYPVLAHLGSTNVSIHTYALISLDNIAIVCGKQNGRLLAMGNMDYIINAISQRISFLYENPQAPLVLKALVRVGGIDTLNYLQDSVEEIFDALDRYHLHDWACHQLCGTLFEIVQTAAASIPSSSSSSS